MSLKQSPSETSGQSIGCDPKSAKRNSGLFAFLKWFKPSTSRESITADPQISQSSSCDSLNSTHSAGTVASFSFVLPSDYKKCASEKCIALGPETDTYKARLKQRDKRKENDKNLTLRKKYNLFFNRDTLSKGNPVEIDEENSKSLPLMTRGGVMESLEVHRRTISESSNIRRVGAHSHVKGKRKAPQPPPLKISQEGMSTASLRRIKRLAPTPPPVSAEKVIKSIGGVDKGDPQVYEDMNVICNDSLKLDNGILKPAKGSPSDGQKENALKPFSKSAQVETPVSPRPWYKRNNGRENNKKVENKYEPIERLPEVPFSRNSSLDLTLEESIYDKRKSGMSFLTNISELDREASEIIKTKEQVKSVSVEIEKMPEFMRPKEVKVNLDSWVSPKRRSARDLIAKFNAITNVTKATVFGSSHRENQPIGKQRSLDEGRRRQEQLLESHQKAIEEIDKKKVPLAKSGSTTAVVPKQEAPSVDKKSWFCPKCNIGNEYWRIICHVCSSIKPYFDDLSTPFKEDNKVQLKCSSPLIVRKEKLLPQKMEIERSKTQIEFSALAGYSKNKVEQPDDKETQKELDDKREQRERLKKMLIDMKNSLPKRKSAFQKQNKNGAKNEELTEEPKEDEVAEAKLDEKSEAPEPTETTKSDKTQEEKVAEILIGTTQTIYENIKMKKTDNPKLLKVSSSAQTSGVVKQIVPSSALTNLVKNQTKHNNYELMRPKDFESIYSDSNSKSAAAVYANLSRNHELSLFFNMPKNLKDNSSSSKPMSNTDTLRINVLLKKLEHSISKGELKDAAVFAEELAQLKVNCSVIRQKPKTSQEIEKKIHVEMYVEDKVSHRGPFPIEVFPDQTVAHLKIQIENEFEIPVAYQRWILGKELVTNDNSTVKDHNITEGCPVFLYLVAPDVECNKVQQKSLDIGEPKQSTSGKISELPRLETKEGSSSMKNEIDTVKNNVQDLQNILRENKNKSKTPESSDHAPKIVHVIRKTTETPSKNEVIIPVEVENSNNKQTNNTEKTEAIKKTREVKTQLLTQENKSVEVKPIIQYVFPTIQNSYQEGSIEKETASLPKIAMPAKAPTEESSSSKVPPRAEEEDLEYEETKTLKPPKEWECHLCTLLNPVNSNVCAVCATVRLQRLQPQPTREREKRKAPQPKQVQSPKKDQTYLQLVNLDNADLVENNVPFECMICFLDILPREGATLRECLHQFCKPCLAHTIEFADEAEVKCPYRDDNYSCTIALQDREIKALVEPGVYEQHLAKSIAQAENKIDKSFHCKTPDCKGWCIFEDNVNEFRCPVCKKLNCLTCQAIHGGLNCKQYQERMNAASEIDDEAKRTKDMLEEMVNKGEAIECPTCKVILMKKWGCDWLRCSMCKTEICWVTRGPRWGPAGKGDTTGGCQCGVNGVKCHPKCNYCH
ncbi:hypothetical protein JTB14_022370 [Gonioctena quinquepunctata]|nr:hypothetical protein JTB14_022370 [Gonioctena quinquepunctata]